MILKSKWYESEREKMNDTDKRIKELEQELERLKKQRNNKKEYILRKNTDIVFYTFKNREEKYFDNFKDLFEYIKKKIGDKYKFSIWYKNIDFETDEFKEWNVNSFNENEILEILSNLNAYQILTAEICIANKKEEILHQVYFRFPFLQKYDDVIFQRHGTNDQFSYFANEGKKWRMFKDA